MFTPVNVVGSSYENLGGSISVNAATFLNDDFLTDPLMPDLEDTIDLQVTGIFSGAYNDEDVGAEADLNNLETTMSVSPIPTTKIHKDHPKEQIIGDINLATQTRRMIKMSNEHAMTSVPIPNVADEAVFKERDDRVVRATTTAASLDAAHARDLGAKKPWRVPLLRLGLRGHQDLTDFVPPTPYDLPLLGGHTHRSNEGRSNINELMAICTNLSNMILALEQSKTAQELVINKLQKKVKRLEKALRERTLGMKLFKIGTSRRKGLDKENVSKQGRKSDKTNPMFKDSDFDVLDDAMENVEGGNTAEQITTVRDTLNTTSINVSTVRPSNGSATGPSTSTIGDIFEDEMTTIADTLMAIRSARPRTTLVLIRNVEEEPRRATPVPTVQSQDKGKGKMVEPEPTPKNPRKAQIQMDEELAQRLFEEEQAQFEKEQRIARERATEQEAKDAALIEQMEDVQAGWMLLTRKKFFAAQRAVEIRNRQPTRTQLRNQMITYLKHMGNRKKDDSSSKQAENSKKRPRAEHDEESVKKQKLQDDAEKEELRAYGSSKNYKIFSEMLDDFDRQDVMDLHRLVKE
ncbi:hypothetical protein Tco_1356567, partial [Tanacetum coccineum]